MKERLVQLLDLEQLTPSKFADIIGVQRSSVSHVISGRNNPSFDFLQKTLNAFPGLNAEWLILGKGTMYEQMGRSPSGTLFDTPVPQSEETDDTRSDLDESRVERDLQEEKEDDSKALPEAKPVKEEAESEAVTSDIIRVILLNSDGTFSTFEPS